MKSLLLKGLEVLNLYPWFNRYTSNTATVFMLHGVSSDSNGERYEISVDQLRGFLDYLKRSAYSVISLAEYTEALRNQRDLYKTVVFTVDDGYRNFYLNSYPLFREYDYPATIFVTTDFIDRKVFLWWDKIEYAITTTTQPNLDLSEHNFGVFQLGTERQKALAVHRITEQCKLLEDHQRRAMVDRIVTSLDVDLGGQPSGKYEPLTWEEILKMNQHKIDFYPHTRTHPIMSRLPYEQKLAELTESKKILENRLGRTLDIFAYPNGKIEDIDADTIKALRETGYSAAVTSIPGFNHTKVNNNLYMLHRFAIPHHRLWFKQYVSGMEYAKNRIRKM
ncbi:MAG: polysaccharide deacetylase family protein [Candidatus Zixiibacteriota bacterium]|nr:MAG: polysaccharide deacetylase family protein [candidate division Zixibacteria bacterium]